MISWLRTTKKGKSNTGVREYRKKHVFRLHEAPEKGRDDNLYVDILSNVERIGDHCNNIAINIIQESYYPD
ncbi:MAG: hypothetical protein ACOC14_04270, partial [Bacillota bacterium]